MKYKVTLDIHGEPLIRLLARYAPFDITAVEELPPEPVSSPLPTRVLAKQLVRHLDKPQIKKVNRRGANRFNPNKGVNKILLDMLADGQPHHAIEADGAIKEAGYSPNGLYSRIQRLERHGLVFQPRKGLWQLVQKDKKDDRGNS